MGKKRMSTYKVVLVGDGGVGKSTLINRHRTGEFKKRYIPTVGVEVHPLVFHTNEGPMCLNIWDCAGQEKFGGLRDGYYIQAQAAIVAFDLTQRNTFESVPTWLRDVKRVCGSIPTVIVGNKVDLLEERRLLVDTYGITYYDYSAKSNYNFEKPFLALLRQLTGKQDLYLVESPARVLDPLNTPPFNKEDRITELLQTIKDATQELEDLLQDE